jgi:peptidoglycan biosynthesis protein MviN/MurJ (putative lipid II flippase)
VTETLKQLSTSDRKPQATFFRQSGWLMISNIAAGMMTLGVHPLNKMIPDAEYSAFGVLLMLVTCLPTLPLQMVLAEQTARALATGRERQLSGMIRAAWLWTFLVWAVGAGAVFLFRGAIVQHWQLPGAAGLVITLPLLLANLLVPLFSGALQGRQDFFWMGWTSIVGGVGRLGFAAVFVVGLGLGAAGLMGGTLIGVGLAASVAIWRTRDLWLPRPERFDGQSFLRQILPLLFGYGAFQFLFTSDTLYAKAFFSPDAMKAYVAAGTLSRGMLWIAMPLASVMFPKLVQSRVRREKSNLFGIVVLGTAVIGIGCMVALWIAGPLAVRMVFKSSDVAATVALIPWYAGAMVPLAMANVLVNDFLARARFAPVPFLVAVAVGYGFALPAILRHFPGRLEVVLQTLGGFNLLLLAGCACFAWGTKKRLKAEG